MRILIMGFTKLKYMPYLKFYTDIIDKEKNSVDVLVWNRDGKEDILPEAGINLIEFNRAQQDEVAKFRKITSFLKYRSFAKRVLTETKYDFVIILHTLPAVLVRDILKKNYQGRYILDYRDYTFEKVPVYRQWIAQLVNCSVATFVSSNAFRKYLPSVDKIYASHNILLDSLKHRDVKQDWNSQCVRIRYWGLIRYADTQIELIRHIANDPRFEMHFHGREQGECKRILDYCQENNVSNVYFHGEYTPEERYQFAAETDLIQNVQDFDSITENAISNKFYDGAIFYIPQICSDKSYMGKCLEKYSIGLSCSVYDENIADKLYDYCTNINVAEFKKKCDAFMEEILKEYESGIGFIKQTFN